MLSILEVVQVDLLEQGEIDASRLKDFLGMKWQLFSLFVPKSRYLISSMSGST